MDARVRAIAAAMPSPADEAASDRELLRIASLIKHVHTRFFADRAAGKQPDIRRYIYLKEDEEGEEDLLADMPLSEDEH